MIMIKSYNIRVTPLDEQYPVPTPSRAPRALNLSSVSETSAIRTKQDN